jgi:hypothetical protein
MFRERIIRKNTFDLLSSVFPIVKDACSSSSGDCVIATSWHYFSAGTVEGYDKEGEYLRMWLNSRE